MSWCSSHLSIRTKKKKKHKEMKINDKRTSYQWWIYKKYYNYFVYIEFKFIFATYVLLFGIRINWHIHVKHHELC